MASQISSNAAAAALGLSPIRVRELITAGELRATKVGGRWFVDRDAIDALIRRPRPTGRPLDPETAWALLALAEGRPTPPLTPPQLSRLRRRLRERPDLDVVSAATRRRCRVELMRAHPGVIEDLRADARVVLTGAAAPSQDLVELSAIELYVRAADAERLRAEFRMRSANSGDANVALFVPATPWWPFGADRVAWPAVVALDLFESWEPRSVRAARRLWERTLDSARWEPTSG